MKRTMKFDGIHNYRNLKISHAVGAIGHMQNGLNRNSRIAIWASNYRIFKSTEPMEEPCSKCNTKPEVVQPIESDIFAFKVSLEIRKMLIHWGYPVTLIVIPSDFAKGACPDQLQQIRDEYTLPNPLTDLLSSYRVPGDDVLIQLESTFRSRAQTLLKKRILRDGQLPIINDAEDREASIIFAEFPDFNFPFLRIPLGGYVSDGEGNIMPIPFCQIICSAIYERFTKLGFTDVFALFNHNETPCAPQGTFIARKLGLLPFRTTQVMFYKKKPEARSLHDDYNYPMVDYHFFGSPEE